MEAYKSHRIHAARAAMLIIAIHYSTIGAIKNKNEVAVEGNGARGRYACVSFPFTFRHDTTKAATTPPCWSTGDKNAGKFYDDVKRVSVSIATQLSVTDDHPDQKHRLSKANKPIGGPDRQHGRQANQNQKRKRSGQAQAHRRGDGRGAGPGSCR